MFCDKCGSEIPNDSLFCPNCGNAVGQAPPDMSSTGYRRLDLGNAGVNPPNIRVPDMRNPKRNLVPFITIAVAVVIAAAAVFGAAKLLYKPYMKPMDKLYKAYNTENYQLLSEAVTPDLYKGWNLAASRMQCPGKVSYKVLNKNHVKGSELFSYSSGYGATDCYRIVVRDKLPIAYDYEYGDDFEDYGFYANTFDICKINGSWVIVGYQ